MEHPGNRSGGTAIIDVLMVFDTDLIYNDFGRKPPGPDGVHWLPHGEAARKFAYMVAQEEFVKSGMASTDLVLSVSHGDFIRWRSYSLNGNNNHVVGLNSIEHNTGPHIVDGFKPNADPFTLPIYNPVTKKIDEVPNYKDVYYESKVKEAGGTEAYKVYFEIINPLRKGGYESLGLYAWDPDITYE
jgi:hypothetical protein